MRRIARFDNASALPFGQSETTRPPPRRGTATHPTDNIAPRKRFGQAAAHMPAKLAAISYTASGECR